MFIFGGNTPYGLQNDMWKFNFDTLQWSILYPVNVPEAVYRFGYTSYVIDDTTFFAIYGGKVFEGYSNDLFIYDTGKNEWSQMERNGEDPPEMIFTCLQYFEKKIYLACGENTAGLNDEEIYSTSTFVYDLESFTWSKLELNNEFDHRTYASSALIGSEMFIIYGYSAYEGMDVESIQKLDLLTLIEWENVSIGDDLAIVRDSFASSLYSDKIYLSAGYITSTSETLNDLIQINPSENSFSILADSQDLPSSRMLHSMEVINGQLYIFGGLTDSGLTNELWKFDVESEVWSTVEVQGTSPVARSSHGCDSAGDIMVIWGGLGETGFLSDMHYYNALTNRWTEITVSGTKPSARKGACVEVSLPYVFIFGGQTSEGCSNDLWVYHAGNNMYTLYQQKESEVLPVMMSLCDSEIVDGHIIFYTYTGSTTGEAPVMNLRQFNLTTGKWVSLSDEEPYDMLRTNPLGQKLGKDFIVIAGQSWSTDAWRNIILLEKYGQGYRFVDDVDKMIEEYIWGSAFTYYKNFIYSHGGGTQIGVSIRPTVPTGKFFYLNITLICEILDNRCSATCSPGTYLNTDNVCELCEKGTYAEGFGNTNCIKCPSGTYNMYNGANSLEQCYPCPEGYFNNIEGKSICLACPPGYSCPSGSKKPSFSGFESDIISDQPSSYSKNTKASKAAMAIWYYVFLALILLMLLIILIFRNKVIPLIVKLDIFTDGHNYNENLPLMLKKTIIGGSFTLIFILVALLLIISRIINFEYNNITENKTLIPLVIIYDEVSAFQSDIYMKLNLLRYGGTCKEVDGETNKTLTFYTVNIRGKFEQTSAKVSDLDCEIEYFCSKCSLDAGAYFYFSAKEKTSYASALSLNITAESSIESSKSSLYFLLKTPENSIFRGSEPTVFKISSIPSLYRKGLDGNDHTGYHLSVNSQPQEGSYYTTQEIAFTADLNVKIEFDISDSSLYTVRYQTESEIYMINALVGSVFGILSAVKMIMKIVEKSETHLYDFIKQKKRSQGIIQKRLNLQDQIMKKDGIERVQTIRDSFFQTIH